MAVSTEATVASEIQLGLPGLLAHKGRLLASSEGI